MNVKIPKHLVLDIIKTLAPTARGTRLDRIQSVLGHRRDNVRLVSENVCSEHNLNACLRTVEGMGLQHFHHVESLAPFKPADYHYARWMTVHRHEAAAPCMEELKKEGFTILATTLSPTAVSLDRLDLTNRKVAVVFGNETHGVSSSTLELADAHVTLPMLGFTQSYNVSVASALVLSRLLITTPMLPVCVPAGAEDPRRRPPEWPAMLQNFLDWQLPSQTAPPPTTGPLAVSDTPLPPPLLNAAPLGTDERLALTASFLLQSSKFGIQLLRQKGIFLEGM